MRAGQLDKTIELQRASHEADDYGTPLLTWTAYATVRAHMLTAGAKEFIEAAGAITKPAVVFRVRYRDDALPGDRVVWGERIFAVTATRELGRREGTEIHCLAICN